MWADVFEVLDNLEGEERQHLLVLFRGIAHSSIAREEFNALCLSWNVEPNQMISALRSTLQTDEAG